MSHTKKIIAAGALFGFVLATAALLTTPFNATARAAGDSVNIDAVIAERIGGAFAVIDATDLEPTERAVVVHAGKGDLPADRACADQTWPAIAPGCLTTADGSAAPEARFVTVGYQAGEAETVLLRIPASELAAR